MGGVPVAILEVHIVRQPTVRSYRRPPEPLKLLFQLRAQ